MKKLILVLFALITAGSVTAIMAKRQNTKGQDTATSNGLKLLEEWHAGNNVSAAAVQRYGIERCFVSEPLSNAVFSRMQGRSYKSGCSVPRGDLRYVRVLHYDPKGKIRLGEMVCNKAIAADVVSIFRELYNARYPIERMVLVDNYGADDERSMTANNTSCFNYRTVAGSKKLSNHSLGRAVDVNPLYNPQVVMRQGRVYKTSPKAGRKYADRSLKLPMIIKRGDICYRLFIKHGFSWGGNWHSSKDYQHFEK